MPPRAKTTKKRAAAGKRYPLNMRTTADLRRKLEAATMASGRSLAQEIEYRCEASFSEEAAYGGIAMKNIAARMAIAFHNAGTAAAAATGHPDWSPEEWMLDENCYRTAVFGVIGSLLKVYPGADLERVLQVVDGIPLMVHSLKGQVATVLLNEARRAKGA